MISTLILCSICFVLNITKCASIYFDDYKGEYFPTKFLVPDDISPTMNDVNLYVESLKHLVKYCTNLPNNTDVNQGLGLFYTKALLKRSLQDYGHKIDDSLKIRLKALVNDAELVTSHYVYQNSPYGWTDQEFRVTRIFKEDESQVYSIEPFNRHRLIKWLLSRTDMNAFSRDFDTITLPKERYVELVSVRDGYYINSSDSDECLSKIAYNPIPIDLSHLRACKLSRKCDRVIHGTPSVAYSLSHRLMNMMLIRHVRRCYLRSPEGDREEMDNMCAFMYREAVYLARRGFFARDLFLEHLALCSLLGYEEFHRRNWYHKVSSWVDEGGCIAEEWNFQVNHSMVLKKHLSEVGDKRRLKELMKTHKQQMLEYCQTHPMALLKIVLAHGIRHALHHLPI